jgi:Reverse transcriptase (RNA-dependent DNA polymerase).
MELIKKKLEVKVESDNMLVSFDVISLFPSIPLEKVLISLEKWLTSLTFSKFETSEYEQLTKLCIFHNAFKFGEKFYIQNNGLAMGNPLSPFLANLFMSELETHITSSFPWMYKSWNRYVNDIFLHRQRKTFG